MSESVLSVGREIEEPRSSKRRRIKTNRFEIDFMENEEKMMLEQAIKVSKMETKRVVETIEDAPIFYPSVEEFMDPMKYISSIRAQAEPYGLCKIVPPVEWKPTCKVQLDQPGKFATKKQHIHHLQQGQGFDDGKRYTLYEYKLMADAFYDKWKSRKMRDTMTDNLCESIMSHESLCKDYWDMVETSNGRATVEYGNDINTGDYISGFPLRRDNRSMKSDHANQLIKLEHNGSTPQPVSGVVTVEKDENGKEETHKQRNQVHDSQRTQPHVSFTADFYTNTGWNLNNIPTTKGSLLSYLRTPINGINVPWLYVGMLFASFCWHNEDNYFYSINYSHYGAVKQWYGVPGAEADRFEKVSKEFLLGLFRESPDLLHHMTTQIFPHLLKRNGVPVYKMTQEPRTFIITFPKSFHAGFSYGFNVGEAVNFAPTDWLLAGGEADRRYRSFARESVVSHDRLLYTLAKNKDSLKGISWIDLARELGHIVDEEVRSRPILYQEGIRDLRKEIQLPANDFKAIDDDAVKFDEMRMCCVCKHVCIMTAVACECDSARVACTRHHRFMCKCPTNKKFVLGAADDNSFPYSCVVMPQFSLSHSFILPLIQNGLQTRNCFV